MNIPRNVAILHDSVDTAAGPAHADVLVQCHAVKEALHTLGAHVVVHPVSLDLRTLKLELDRVKPDVVFNLVESFALQDRLIDLVPALLERWEIPFTGSSAQALKCSSDKIIGKEILRAWGIPVPAAYTCAQAKILEDLRFAEPRSFILKAIAEHASLGMDDDAVVKVEDGSTLLLAMQRQARRMHSSCMAEAYIDGREFNLSLLESPDGLKVLPAAEIDFSTFSPDKPRIVGFKAKWDSSSQEYRQTPRRFVKQGALVADLTSLALQVWTAFNLNGYARVDFRVDRDGKPWILEANANPCLAPDAGFAAALTEAEIAYPQAIEWIVAAALERKPFGV